MPLLSAATAPASIVSVPLGSSEPAIHFLRAVTGLAGVEEPGAARAVRDRLQADARMRPEAITMWVPALRRDLAGFDLGLHAAARKLGAGGARHRLDLAA